MQWIDTPLLDSEQHGAVRSFFSRHPILGPYLDSFCVALTGSYAFGLGGPGADIDVSVICPDELFDEIRARLVAAGRFGAADEPGEDITGVVGDHSLEPVSAIWERVRDYRDMASVFVCAHLVPLSGQISLAGRLIGHCRTLPEDAAERARTAESAVLGQNVYAFLRSFQTGDALGRLLARSNILRASMRMTFLAERQAPPYDKHLAGLTLRLAVGAQIMRLIADHFGAEPPADEVTRYSAVAAAPDWRKMYAAAEDTPVMRFVKGAQGLLGGR